jgi:hypothetical protein
MDKAQKPGNSENENYPNRRPILEGGVDVYAYVATMNSRQQIDLCKHSHFSKEGIWVRPLLEMAYDGKEEA